MINKSVTDLHIVPDIAKQAVMIDGMQYEREGPIAVTTTYLNTWVHPITIVTRSGLRISVPVEQNEQAPRNVFIIRTRMSIKNAAWGMFQQITGACADSGNNYLKLVMNIASNHTELGRRHFATQERTLVIDHIIDPSTLMRNKNSYNRTHDIVISTETPVLASPHPFSDDTSVPFKLPTQADDTDMGSNMAVQMELIQGDEPLQTRYISFSGKVLPIYPKKDLRRQPGLYMTYLERDTSTSKGAGVRAVSTRYDIDEIEKTLNIFKTPEQAAEAGDVRAGQKVLLAELEQQNAIIKRQTELDRTQLEASLMAYREKELKLKEDVLLAQARADEADRARKIIEQQSEREKKTLEEYYEGKLRDAELRTRETRDEVERKAQLRKDYYEERSLERKDNYDRKSTDRKDTSDLLKFVPALLLGVGAIAAGLAKLYFS